MAQFIVIYVFRRRRQLIDAGLSRREIEQALQCCLIRVRRDFYSLRELCEDPRHAALRRIGEAPDVTLIATRPGLHGDIEALRTAIASRRGTLPADAVFSHLSAALLHGLGLVSVPSQDVELIRPSRSRTLPGMVTRKRVLGEGETTSRNGYPFTGLARTLGDVCVDYPPWIAVPLIDSALTLDPHVADGLVAIGSARFAGARRARIQRMAGLSDPLRESPAESLCAMRFVEYGLDGFEPQIEIIDENGALAGRADFVHRRARIVVEVDGQSKYSLDGKNSDEEFRRERDREYRLRNLGFAVFRLTWADLFRARVFLQIRELLHARPAHAWAG